MKLLALGNKPVVTDEIFTTAAQVRGVCLPFNTAICSSLNVLQNVTAMCILQCNVAACGARLASRVAATCLPAARYIPHSNALSGP